MLFRGYLPILSGYAMAAEDAIEEGLVWIFAQLEPCNTFSFRYVPDAQRRRQPVPLPGRLAGRQCALSQRAGHRRRPQHGDPAAALHHRTQTNP
jgi:hypothetical protein